MVSGWQSSSQGHHSSSSSGVPRVAVKKSIRSSPDWATGPTSMPASRRRSRAPRPAVRGTSSTSWIMPVAVMKLARGWLSAQRSIWPRSVVDCVCQAKETGCRAGVGQPMRSHEHRYPRGWAAGAMGMPASATARSSPTLADSSVSAPGDLGRRRSHWEILLSVPRKRPESAPIYPLTSAVHLSVACPWSHHPAVRVARVHQRGRVPPHRVSTITPDVTPYRTSPAMGGAPRDSRRAPGGHGRGVSPPRV
ncbi:hypothetical protein SGRI78S_07191 [Streptomyces griseus subsp. griseus]